MERFRQSKGLKRRVLVVDDELINREILRNILENDYEVICAGDGREALNKLTELDWDVSLIMLDLMMPVMDGYTLLKLCRENQVSHWIPIIVMTSDVDAELKSIRMGADDFIAKPYNMPDVILARCDRLVELSEDRNIISYTEKDRLTGLYTKDYFYQYIHEMERYGREYACDAVAMNIDQFHLVNEIYGRTVGDKVLKKVADIIIHLLQDGDGIAYRGEADHFYIYCYHRDNYDDFLQVVQEEISTLTEVHGVRIRIGVYPIVDKTLAPEAWFDRAKQTCNGIRGDYSRRIDFYDNELHEKSLYEERLVGDIDEAIAKGHLMVYYQPKYNIQNGEPRLSSAEALVRWKHPELGMISPGTFIPLFERNGLIQKVDYFVWKETGRQIKAWKDTYGVTVPVSVNMSRIDIYDRLLETKLERILAENDLTTKELMLEITESAYVDDPTGMLRVLDKLRSKGFKVELDDFGTGYSSLSMLAELSIDVLKMDMIFVRNMERSPKGMQMVEMIMGMAKFLGVPVVAEGVEEQSQLDILKKLGCEVIQGYYFSKPLPPEEFVDHVEREKRRIENDNH